VLVTPALQAAAFGEHVSMRPFFFVLVVFEPKVFAPRSNWEQPRGQVHAWHPLGMGTRAASLLLSHPLGQNLTEKLMLVPLSREIAEELNKREVLHLVP